MTYRTVSSDFIDTEYGEVELPIADSSRMAGDNHKATIMADGTLLVSYLVPDTEYRTAEDALGDFCTYVECDDVVHALNSCHDCYGTEETCECEMFCGSDEHIAWKGARLYPVFVFMNGGQSGMEFVDDDELHRATGWLVFADDVTFSEPGTSPHTAAESIRQEWLNWANGDVYGIVHARYLTEEFDDTRWQPASDVDSCWGFVGFDWAMSELSTGHVDIAHA